MAARLLLSYGNVDWGETQVLGKERLKNETAKRWSVSPSLERMCYEKKVPGTRYQF